MAAVSVTLLCAVAGALVHVLVVDDGAADRIQFGLHGHEAGRLARQHSVPLLGMNLVAFMSRQAAVPVCCVMLRAAAQEGRRRVCTHTTHCNPHNCHHHNMFACTQKRR